MIDWDRRLGYIPPVARERRRGRLPALARERRRGRLPALARTPRRGRPPAVDWERRLARLPAVDLGDGLRVHEACGHAARRRGLGGLTDLPADRALRMRGRAVHTLTMRFALDLIWLDGEGRVVRVDRGVAPRRHRACTRARAVVETRAGCADRFLRAGVGGYTRLY